MRMTVGIMALCLLAAPDASAFDTSKLGEGGSLPLDDIMPLIEKSPKLRGEVTATLAKSGKKAEDIICSGARFPRSWENLGGGRAAPYTCELGDQMLTIRADVRVTGRTGKVYDKITRDAMKSAETVTENNPTWTWTKSGPADKPK